MEGWDGGLEGASSVRTYAYACNAIALCVPGSGKRCMCSSSRCVDIAMGVCLQASYLMKVETLVLVLLL